MAAATQSIDQVAAAFARSIAGDREALRLQCERAAARACPSCRRADSLFVNKSANGHGYTQCEARGCDYFRDAHPDCSRCQI